MHDLLRWSVAVTLVLLVPIIPFLSFGDSLEAQVEHWCDASLTPATTAGIVVVLLASDILLPIPRALSARWPARGSASWARRPSFGWG